MPATCRRTTTSRPRYVRRCSPRSRPCAQRQPVRWPSPTAAAPEPVPVQLHRARFVSVEPRCVCVVGKADDARDHLPQRSQGARSCECPFARAQSHRRAARGTTVPQDLRASHGFDNQANQLTLSPLLFDAFLRLSVSVVKPDFNENTVGIWNTFFKALPPEPICRPKRANASAAFCNAPSAGPWRKPPSTVTPPTPSPN